MRISKQTKKTTLAQQGRYLLICLLSMLLLFLAGSVLILNRTQRQVYEQLEEISKLYTDELDNRFFRISRNLFSTVMDGSNPNPEHRSRCCLCFKENGRGIRQPDFPR